MDVTKLFTALNALENPSLSSQHRLELESALLSSLTDLKPPTFNQALDDHNQLFPILLRLWSCSKSSKLVDQLKLILTELLSHTHISDVRAELTTATETQLDGFDLQPLSRQVHFKLEFTSVLISLGARPSAAGIHRMLAQFQHQLTTTVVSTEPSLLYLATILAQYQHDEVNAWLEQLSAPRRVYKPLIKLLEGDNVMTVAAALALLAHMLLDDDALGAQLFNNNNIQSTFQVLTNLISSSITSNSELYACISYALAAPLLSHKRIAQQLTDWSGLNNLLQQIVRQITASRNIAQYTWLQLWLAVLHVERLRGAMIASMHKLQVWSDVLHACMQPSYPNHISFGMDAIRLLFNDYPRDKAIIAACTQATCRLAQQDSNDSVSSLLVELAQSAEARRAMQQHLNIAQCTAQARSAGPTALMEMVNVPVLLQDTMPAAASELEVLAASDKFAEVIAQGLASCHRQQVMVSLTLLQQGVIATKQQQQQLVSCLLDMNTQQEQASWLNSSQMHEESALHIGQLNTTTDMFTTPNPARQQARVGSAPNCNHQGDVDAELNSTVERVKHGLQLRDMQTSEAMQMYDQQLKAAAEREAELIGLLDSKTAALQAADVYLAQARQRQSEHDSELTRIRQLLHTSESQREAAETTATRRQEQIQQMSNDCHRLLARLEELEHVQGELRAAQEAYEAQSHALQSRDAVVQQQADAIAQEQRQHEVTRARLNKLESEHHTLAQQHAMVQAQLQDAAENGRQMEASLNAAQRQLQDQAQHIQTMTHERQGLQAALDSKRAQLHTQTERATAADANVVQLRNVNQRLETRLAEAEDELRKLKAEASRNAEMIAMIHNLSSGKSH